MFIVAFILILFYSTLKHYVGSGLINTFVVCKAFTIFMNFVLNNAKVTDIAIYVYETSGLIDFFKKRTLTLCDQFRMFEIFKSSTKPIFVSLSFRIVTIRLNNLERSNCWRLWRNLNSLFRVIRETGEPKIHQIVFFIIILDNLDILKIYSNS